MTYSALQAQTNSLQTLGSTSDYVGTGTDEAEFRQWQTLNGRAVTEDDYSDDLSIAFPIGDNLVQ